MCSSDLAPTDPSSVAAPGNGKVDAIDEVDEPEFMGGRCKRISIFLSVFDIHVQRAPVSGTLIYEKRTPGQFITATKSDCGGYNENVLLGFEASRPDKAKIGCRLIAGLIARRIIPWVQKGETVQRSERISLIQYGSRCDLYLPMSSKIRVKLGDRVRVGQSVVADL